ncbi:transaldolase family protein, partial [Faecalibaculum rodentium]
MEFMLDTADVARIRDLNELITVAGVTTNPTILTKSGRMPEDVLPEIISILSPEQKLFVQVVKTDYEGIMEEARKISAMRPENMYVKIPVS